MPSNLPVIKVRTSEENAIKIKTVAKYNKISVSKEIEKLIVKDIEHFENKYGKIEIVQMTKKEIIEDIKNRIQKNPPY